MKKNPRSPNSKRFEPGRSSSLSVGIALIMVMSIITWACNSPASEQGSGAASIEETNNQSAAEVNENSNNEAAESQTQPASPVNGSQISPAQAPDKTAGQNSSTIPEPLMSDIRHIEGDPAAPVVIIEYSDFKCPYCAQFATDGLYWIREYYVKTGKVRFAFHHIATLGPESVRSAVASECAAEQNQFWAFHDRVFADQAARHSTLDDEKLIDIAAKLDLDTDAFETCLNADRYTDQIHEQTRKAQQSVGIRATPGFIINDTLLVGVKPFEVFSEIIEQKLQEAGWEEPASGRAPAGPADEIEGLVIYPADPPPAEVLDGVWQNCGIYEEALSIDNILSSLSHGAVWIAYSSTLPAEQVERLQTTVEQSLAQADEPMVILSPGPFSDTPITAVAWRVQLALSDASDPRLEQFIEEFQVGPFTPEPGEPCTGGVGEPVG